MSHQPQAKVMKDLVYPDIEEIHPSSPGTTVSIIPSETSSDDTDNSFLQPIIAPNSANVGTQQITRNTTSSYPTRFYRSLDCYGTCQTLNRGLLLLMRGAV